MCKFGFSNVGSANLALATLYSARVSLANLALAQNYAEITPQQHNEGKRLLEQCRRPPAARPPTDDEIRECSADDFPTLTHAEMEEAIRRAENDTCHFTS